MVPDVSAIARSATAEGLWFMDHRRKAIAYQSIYKTHWLLIGKATLTSRPGKSISTL